ncbi:hypothetical protein SAMN05421768_10668 [Chryseobacterium joostei]|uniref:Uncharacterized protein n=1 Tax=Chryseobacterium joostei TaxID=112234 RepID=A0A1N7IM39_9FLAO|nr:hypothetical protein SAMN05421768_10668 [Chryseobacterium joostei]
MIVAGALLLLLFIFYFNFDSGLMRKPAELTDRLEQTKLVDYKRDQYQIRIGENYKNSKIDWRWNAMSDEDGHISPKGKDAFMYLGEPVIKYNDNEWLVALYITTEKEIITSVICSVVFALDTEKQNAKADFLKLLNKDITQLQNPTIVKALVTKGIYKTSEDSFTSVFSLTKQDRSEYSTFEYKVYEED